MKGYCVSVRAVSDRILLVILNGRPFQKAETSESSEDGIGAFLSDLENALKT